MYRGRRVVRDWYEREELEELLDQERKVIHRFRTINPKTDKDNILAKFYLAKSQAINKFVTVFRFRSHLSP